MGIGAIHSGKKRAPAGPVAGEIWPPINSGERELISTVTPSVGDFKGAKEQKTGKTEGESSRFLKKGLDSKHVLRALYSTVDADECKGSGIYQF
jgi:hypothetical protein